jgi:GntR family transcriptional repressor for pyruvate dehydrogenase complex
MDGPKVSARPQVRRNLLSDQLVEHLEELVVSGDLEPGASLPSEAELAEQFGVSRAVVRDATRTMAARGMVEVRQGKRPTVVGINAGMAGNLFDMALRMDAGALMELVEVRRMLEVTNAQLAANRRDPEDIRKMQDAIDAMKASVGDPLAYDSADLAFHEQLAGAAGNRFLKLLIEALGEPLRASRVESRRGHARRGMEPSVTIAAHQRILEAVAAGDAQTAGREMEQHLDAARADLRAARREAFDQDTENGKGDPMG